MPREKTADEVREEFLRIIAGRCADVIWDRSKTKREAVEAAVFGVLTTLEGSGDFPFCAVIPQPHPEEQRFCAEEGENWYPSPPVEQEAMDMSLLRGEDHHLFQEVLQACIGGLPESLSS